jgi:hypothetical protein
MPTAAALRLRWRASAACDCVPQDRCAERQLSPAADMPAESVWAALQEPTYAVQQLARLLDNLIGTGEQCRWNLKSQCFGGFDIHGKLELDRLFHWKIARLRAA